MRKINCLMTAFVFLFVSICLVEAEFVKDGLVSHWNFDRGEAKDITGEHDGSLIGSVSTVAGKVGDALSFDGNCDNFVEVSSPEGYNFNQSFTWCAWIKTSSGAFVSIFAKSGGKGTDDKGPKTFFVNEGQLGFDTGWVGGAAGKAKVNDDSWHYVAISAEIGEGDDKLQFYVDGQADGDDAMNVNEYPEDGFSVFIGSDCRADGEMGPFDGSIDQVSVYNKVLTDDQIEQNFKAEGNETAVNVRSKLATTWGSLKSK